MGDNMSPADVAAVVGNTDRNNFAYPVYGGNFGGNGGFGSDGGWFWLILILAMMNGGWGNGFGGGFGGDNMYPWLSNGQKEIMQNTNQGFDTLQLANQLTGINSGVQNLSTQLCNCCSDINMNMNSNFANAETAANSRQMANMQQAFSNQLSTLQGFNGVTSQIADASADNRLGIANLNSTILAENCADRAALQEGVRDIISSSQRNTQSILDKLCQLELDGKQDRINELERQVLMKDLQASQVQQTADLRTSQATTANQLVSELRSCPIPAQPVYGNTPIFTCNGNSGCGCGNVYGNTIV